MPSMKNDSRLLSHERAKPGALPCGYLPFLAHPQQRGSRFPNELSCERKARLKAYSSCAKRTCANAWDSLSTERDQRPYFRWRTGTRPHYRHTRWRGNYMGIFSLEFSFFSATINKPLATCSKHSYNPACFSLIMPLLGLGAQSRKWLYDRGYNPYNGNSAPRVNEQHDKDKAVTATSAGNSAKQSTGGPQTVPASRPGATSRSSSPARPR